MSFTGKAKKKGTEMNQKRKLYRGSEKIILTPLYGAGRADNDYGQGFYCTEEIELAKEWACQTLKDGFVSCYDLDMTGLTVLNLTDEPYQVLHWLALLNENRKPSISTRIGADASTYLQQRYLPDISDVDVIIGYRADDSYFSFARSFLNNQISMQQLGKAMKLGKLGEQIVLKSKNAFSRLQYREFEIAAGNIYFHKRQARDEKARNDFLIEQQRSDLDGTYILDLIRESREES